MDNPIPVTGGKREGNRMARLSPEQQVQRIVNTIRGWEAHAGRSSFLRHSLTEFKAPMRPSLAAHARVVDLRNQLRIAILERNTDVRTAVELIYRIGGGRRMPGLT